MEERKNRVIISVSRQFGSGGHKIAEALAEHFELPIYDHRMLDSIAKEKGVDSSVLKKYDEKPLNRFLARNVSGFSSSLENNLAQMQFSYLKDKADSGESFVVVGRCAETVLKEYDGLITIFVLGDEETRVKRNRAAARTFRGRGETSGKDEGLAAEILPQLLQPRTLGRFQKL